MHSYTLASSLDCRYHVYMLRMQDFLLEVRTLCTASAADQVLGLFEACKGHDLLLAEQKDQHGASLTIAQHDWLLLPILHTTRLVNAGDS